MPGRRNIARLITLLAGLILGLVVVIVPSGHFIVSHQYIAGALETEIEINAQMIMQVISANPEMWEFEQARLQEYLSRRAAESQPEIRRVRNMQNEIIAEYATQLSPPVIMRSVPLFDAGIEVGSVEIYRSLNPLVTETLLISLVMLPLGIGTFFILRYLPIRSIYEAERSLRNTNEFLKRVLEDTTDAIAVIDRSGTIIHSNRRASEITGYAVQDLVGRNYKTLLPPEVIPLVRAQAESVMSGSIDSFHLDTFLMRSDGHLRDVSLGGSPLFRDDERAGVIISADDITERKRLEERLRTLSLTDELTGLYNRRGFLAMAEQQIKVAKRLKKATLLVSADLDGLKRINDTWGHQEGDRALVEAGRIMRECFRESDIVARVGGDEFVVFQMENEPVDTGVFLSRVQKRLDLHNAQKNGEYALSLSVGAARFGHDTAYSLAEMLDAVDKMMYERKRQRQGARP